jgi:hypothetical protein
LTRGNQMSDRRDDRTNEDIDQAADEWLARLLAAPLTSDPKAGQVERLQPGDRAGDVALVAQVQR